MLPMLQLPVLEPGVPRAANAAETLLPEGATELHGAFGEILNTRLGPEVATGSALPLTGNALPLLTSPDPGPAVDAKLPLDVTDVELAVARSDYELPAAEPDGRRLPLPEPSAAELAHIPLRAPLEALTQPDAASVREPALQPMAGAAAVGFVARTVSGASGEVADRRVAAAPAADGAARIDAAATGADRTPRIPLAAIAPPSVAEIEAPAPRAPAAAPPARVAEGATSQRTADPLDARAPAAADADSSRLSAPASATGDAARLTRDDAAALTRPLQATVPQPTQVGVETTQPAADIAARPISDAPVSTVRAAPAPSTLVTTLDIPVQDPRWEQALSERIVVLAGGRAHNAEIRLTPAELGPLRVQLTIDDGTAHVAFQAQHALTREALEQAMPRLREMLSEGGLTLGQASVSEQGVTREGREDARGAATAFDGDGDPADAERGAVEVGLPRPRRGDALVDTFA